MCFVVWHWSVIPISFRVSSLALGQSYDCPSASETTLKDMGKWATWIYNKLIIKPQQNKAKQKCLYILTHWGRGKMAAISQTTSSNAFSWMKVYEFRLRFHWSLFLRVQLTIFQHWFRWWLGACQATSHYLNQWWLDYWCIYASLGLNELWDIIYLDNVYWICIHCMSSPHQAPKSSIQQPFVNRSGGEYIIQQSISI